MTIAQEDFATHGNDLSGLFTKDVHLHFHTLRTAELDRSQAPRDVTVKNETRGKPHRVDHLTVYRQVLTLEGKRSSIVKGDCGIVRTLYHLDQGKLGRMQSV